MDKISIENLIIFAHHGLFEEEKVLGQKFALDIDLFLNTQFAALKKDLEKSVHYGELSEKVKEHFINNREDLLETVAENTVKFIFDEYPLVEGISLKLKKPWAPVHLPLDEISVKIKRKKTRVFLGLGSNQGDSKKILEDAIKTIEKKSMKIIKKSSFYETKAWGNEDQRDFLNAVIEIETIFEPLFLLREVQKIENEFGRKREEKWGPRTLDIDVLFYGNKKIYLEDLIIPHPYISERKFVLEPMAEIAPHFIHPVENKPIRQLLENI